MTSLRKKATITASLLVLLCLAPSWAQKQSDTNDADSAAIKQTISDWSSAFNRHDAHACALQYTEDGDFVSAVTGSIAHGRKALEDHYIRRLTGDLKNAHRTDTVVRIKFLSPEIATVNITWEMTGAADNPLRKGIADPILVKQNGQWLIAFFDESDFK